MEAPLLSVLFHHSVPKSPAFTNEDWLVVSEEQQHYVLSDGASISFNSALWARLVAEAFLADPWVSKDWLIAPRKLFEDAHSYEQLLWNEQAAFDRGSFATLLGLTIDPALKVARFLAVGDTSAVILEDGEWIRAFPYYDEREFEQDPELLSTNRAEEAPEPKECFVDLGDLPGTVRVLMMTDALAAWCFREGSRGAERLCELIDSKDFETFVIGERVSGRMKIDDTTLLVLGREALA